VLTISPETDEERKNEEVGRDVGSVYTVTTLNEDQLADRHAETDTER